MRVKPRHIEGIQVRAISIVLIILCVILAIRAEFLSAALSIGGHGEAARRAVTEYENQVTLWLILAGVFCLASYLIRQRLEAVRTDQNNL